MVLIQSVYTHNHTYTHVYIANSVHIAVISPPTLGTIRFICLVWYCEQFRCYKIRRGGDFRCVCIYNMHVYIGIHYGYVFVYICIAFYITVLNVDTAIPLTGNFYVCDGICTCGGLCI